MSNAVSHQSSQPSRRGKFNLATVARIGVLALVLGTGSLGLVRPASAHESNPSGDLLKQRNISLKPVCRVDGRLVEWHPPMSWNDNDCFDFQPLPSSIAARPVFKPSPRIDLLLNTSEGIPSAD